MKKKCNFKLYKKIPTKSSGFELTDPVRNLKQGKSFVCGGYGKDTVAILVKTGKRGDVFPYHIYTKFVKKR